MTKQNNKWEVIIEAELESDNWKDARQEIYDKLKAKFNYNLKDVFPIKTND